jgi:hypothetical protein
MVGGHGTQLTTGPGQSSRMASWAAKVILSEIAFGSCVVFPQQPATTSKVHRGTKRVLSFGLTVPSWALFFG